MLGLAPTTPLTAPSTPRHPLATLAAGLFGGALLGIAARAWMRLISEDPEFTWSGTMFIVIGFTVFGFAQAVVAVVRQRARRRWSVVAARTLGAVAMLPLFFAAGAIMLPTVVGGGMARWRADWRRPLRIVLFLFALAPVGYVGSDLVGTFGWSAQAVAGFLAMLAVYGTIISATRFTVTRNEGSKRLPRWAYVALGVGAIVLVLLPMVGAGLQ